MSRVLYVLWHLYAPCFVDLHLSHWCRYLQMERLQTGLLLNAKQMFVCCCDCCLLGSCNSRPLCKYLASNSGCGESNVWFLFCSSCLRNALSNWYAVGMP